jgi:hypothetical protein
MPNLRRGNQIEEALQSRSSQKYLITEESYRLKEARERSEQQAGKIRQGQIVNRLQL